ncbi:hypothetical protein HDK77DRAFT_450914 [Phyllosticta capitalensis]|uniref:BTB domain-containing protein n=1 Tax=Phyllosticta capitalensis TaxID=121624 RepID=A0ABR1YIW4_9PEZI
MASQSDHDVEMSERIDLAKKLYAFASEGFKSNQYSDLTIRCRDREFYVHKVIVCSQCDFFANACKPDSPFIEARTGVITLDDDPLMIQTFLEWFYSDWYDFEDQSKRTFPNFSRKEAKFLLKAHLYALADKYQASHIKIKVARVILAILEDESEGISAGVRVPLSRRAIVAFATILFESTPDSDRRLRNLVYLYTKVNFAWFMDWSDFDSEMDKIDGFWSGYARFTTFFLSLSRTCPKCLRTGPTAFKDDFLGNFKNAHIVMECPQDDCRAQLPVDEWVPRKEEASEPQDGNPHKRRRSSSSCS